MILRSAFLAATILAGATYALDQTQSTCASKSVATTEKTIVETAVAAGSFKTLAAALKAADLVAPLQGKGAFTVFAPTDAAFAKLPKGEVARLLEPKNKALLQAILKYHVVEGRFDAKHVVKAKNFGTLNGQRVDVVTSDDGVTIDGAKVSQTDIACSNGVIHVIDTVILPSTSDIVATAVEAGSFKTLAAALKAASLVEALQGKGPFTVFAPTDEAFAKLPEGTVASLLKPENIDKLKQILTFHVVPGRLYSGDVLKATKLETLQGQALRVHAADEVVTIGGSRLLKADIDTTNGVIHVIDSVLLPE